jgi:DNA-directed RNA polymerase subunit L
VKILELKDVARKDVPIYYRRLYTGTAVIELINKSQDVHVDFSIEHKPTGQKEILITLLDKVDYPLTPLNSALKKIIDEMDIAGGLPG